jgi:hypothetical protein
VPTAQPVEPAPSGYVFDLRSADPGEDLVAAGAGYPGTSPAGAAPATGESWIYATGAVTMRRGDIKTFTLSESINRGNNTIEMIAERTYVLGWDCCHFAILVDIGVPIV